MKAYSDPMPATPSFLLPAPCRTLLIAAGLATALAVAPAHAERPATVDTAVVAPKGSARVESWYARTPGQHNTWTLAPAYVPIDTLELGGQVARNTTTSITRTALQMKWSMTPAQRDGCQLGLVLGVGRAQHSPDQRYLNTLMSCNDTNGAMHFNVGRTHQSGGSSATTWGVSFEIPDGRYTGFAEAFGQRGAMETTTYQLGLRAALGPQWQVDGTIGRVRPSRESTAPRENIYSIGIKRSF